MIGLTMASDNALAELLTLNCRIGQFGETIYTNSEGQLHRVHGPALIFSNGDAWWYQNGQLHREDGPAVIYANGQQRWFLNWKELSQYVFDERVKSL